MKNPHSSLSLGGEKMLLSCYEFSGSYDFWMFDSGFQKILIPGQQEICIEFVDRAD
jgi:hypothetical protein